MGTDLIRLSGLRASGVHGVLDEEKQHPQPFTVDAELRLDLSIAGRSDDLADTVSYAAVAEIIESAVTDRSFDLIEALAETIAQAVLMHDERIFAVVITVHKPEAPMPQSFADVAVTVERHRHHARPNTGTEQPHQMEAGASGYLQGRIAGVYEGELVDDDPAAESQAPVDEDRFVTPTAGLGFYERQNLAELRREDETETQVADAGSGAQPTGEHLRDPDLAADFPVRAVLALGSNLGDSHGTLRSAVTALNAHEQVSIIAISPLARTKPVGGPAHQRDFLNQVIEVETRLSPHALLDVAQQVEAEHNRVREERWGPRTLDVDIVTYAGAVIDSPRLQVPHPFAAERAFVLLPWSWMNPVALLGRRPVRELAAEAGDFHDVHRLPEGTEEEPR